MIDEKKLIQAIKARQKTHEEKNEYFKRVAGSDFLIINRLDELNEVLKMIEEQTKVDEWIPCSERLPKEDGLYVITVRYSGLRKPTVIVWDFLNGKWWNRDEDDEVLAWMPIPEPYKEEKK